MTQKKMNNSVSARTGLALGFAAAGLMLTSCASKQLSFDPVPATASAPQSALQKSRQFNSNSNTASHLGLHPSVRAQTRAQTRKQNYVTRPTNLAVRRELTEEMTSLDQLEQARAKLRAEFNTQPLLGPITMKHLDDILVAEFDANRLQAQYLANNRDQARKRNSLSSLGRVINEVPPRIELSDLNSGRDGQASGAFAAKLRGPLLASRDNTGIPLRLPAKVANSARPLLVQAAANRHRTTLGDAARANEADLSQNRVMNEIPPVALPPEAGVFVETHIEDGSEPARKMAGRVLRGQSLEPGVISEAPPLGIANLNEPPGALLKKLNSLEDRGVELSQANETPLIFDIPMTYNARVSFWIRYFQTVGRTSFRGWLERSSKFIPLIQYELTRAGLPQDLVYVAMIESGFSSSASSHAAAIGLWQFIEPTGRRYGLKTDWWLDERRDFIKSTRAAINYMGDLYHQFNSWYLVAASYNMGENGVRRLMTRYKTNNFWELADRGALPNETTNYVPKIIAATLIAKAPALYGFRDLNYQMPVAFEYFNAPGGTDISNLAQYLGVSGKYLKDLNPELTKGFVPRGIGAHRIRIPKGAMLTVSQYVKLQAGEDVSF